MKYLSVCAGIEAASVAWHHMGWEPVAFSEIEKFPSAVLAHHYPNVPNWGDMTKFKDWPDANLDVLVGGTPCQSFSVAGLRKGLDDPRGNLMLTFGAIAKRYRPQWLVWENVPGVLSSNGGRDFGAFLGMLAELGYGFSYRVLDAQYFGVAQRRRRVFVVGYLGDWHRAAAVLFERHSLSGHPAPSRQARKGTAASTASSTGAGGWPAEISPTLNAHFGSKQGLEDQHVNGGEDCLCPPVAMCLITKTRLDSETETLIPTTGGGFDAVGVTIHGTDGTTSVASYTDVSSSLRSRIPSGVENSTTTAVLQPIPYDLYQITAPVNRQNRKPGDPCHTLARDNAAHAAVAIQGTLIGRGENAGPQGSGADVSGAMFTLTKTDVHAVAFPWQSALDPIGNPTDISGTLVKNQTMAVAFGVGEQPDIGHCLRSGASKADKHESTTYVAQPYIGGVDYENNAHGMDEATGPLLKGSPTGGGRPLPAIATAMQVRRLTPVECSRLQGFPDTYLELTYGTESEAHASQVLHELWKQTGAIAREGWRLGIVASLLTPEVLLAGVYGGWVSWKVAASCACSSGEVSGKVNYAEGFMRRLQEAGQDGRSPYQRESFRQLAGELGCSLSQLPLEEAQAREILFCSELWSEAQRTWPLRYALATETQRRSGKLNADGPRYKALGNSMAVPVMRWIGERINKVEAL